MQHPLFHTCRAMLPLIAGCLLALLALNGCAKQSGTDTARGPELAVTHLVYYEWYGMSPGGDFTRTGLMATEIDLQNARVRSTAAQAEWPQPMLPHQRAAIQQHLAHQPWRPLGEDDLRQLQRHLQDWMQTQPPDTYTVQRGLGIEDGYAQVMIATTRDGAHVTSINPRAGMTGRQTPAPPEAWHQLIRHLVQFHGWNREALLQ